MVHYVERGYGYGVTLQHGPYTENVVIAFVLRGIKFDLLLPRHLEGADRDIRQ